MSSDGVTTLVEEKLFALSNPYELDGLYTTHPVDARGFAPMQCYLLKEGESALLVGTGLSIHEAQVLEQIESVLGSARLSIMPLGIDFTRICNARPIADRFGVEYVYEPPNRGENSAWLNIRPEFPKTPNGLLASESRTLRMGQALSVDVAGARPLDLLVPGLRLLPNQWVYDAATRTMFTQDTFTWVWWPDATGPWVIDEEVDDPTTVETVRHALFYNRFWWLAGADTTRIRGALAGIFGRYEIENIAPDHGCLLKGAAVVGRHFALLDEVLAAAPSAAPLDVSTWTFGGSPA